MFHIFLNVSLGVEREFFRSDRSTGTFHSAVRPEEEQQRQQLQR